MERRCFPSYILMSTHGGTYVFIALVEGRKRMMMPASGDDPMCFPCLSMRE